jgi:hypothetical protein
MIDVAAGQPTVEVIAERLRQLATSHPRRIACPMPRSARYVAPVQRSIFRRHGAVHPLRIRAYRDPTPLGNVCTREPAVSGHL